MQSCPEEIKGAAGESIARRTPLGWTGEGNLAVPSFRNAVSNTHFTLHSQHSEMVDIDRSVRRFWETEEIGPKICNKPFNRDEKSLTENTKQLIDYKDGRCYVTILKKKDAVLPDSGSYDMANKRSCNTEKGLARKPEIAKEYCRAIEYYIRPTKGCVIKQEESANVESDTWYVPHFPVVRQDKETTKVRIVFDAPAKAKGISLNDVLEPGPKLQSDLFSILVNFRKHRVALVCDISEMYV